MKLTPFVSLLLAVVLSAAAPTHAQTVKRFFDYEWKQCDEGYARFYSVMKNTDSGWHRTDFYMEGKGPQMDGTYEDSACQIPNGQFVYGYYKKKVQAFGRYLHGKKDGLWMSYHYNGALADSTVYQNGNPVGISLSFYPDGMIRDSIALKPDGSGIEIAWHRNGNPSAAGAYTIGTKKNGRWQYFHDNGKISAVELYEQDSLKDKQYFDENGQPAGGATGDRKPQFKNGEDGWHKWLHNHLYWPDNYELTGVHEVVIVFNLTVDASGNVKDVYVSTPFFSRFNESAMNVIRNSPKWEPAIRHNRRVEQSFPLAIFFYDN